MEGQIESNNNIVVIGSCSVDFTTYGPRLPVPGETLIGHKFTTSYGGKGANQCVAAAKLGGKTHMISRVGNDQWGSLYKENLKNNGVDVSNVLVTPDITTGIAQISVASNGENQIVIVPGANGKLSKADVKNTEELIKTAHVLVGQLETPYETTLEAFKINNNIKILNAAPGNANIEEILKFCTILCVNETEAALIAGMPVDSVELAVNALRKLLEMGCKAVLITLGENGALYSSNDDSQIIHVFTDRVKPIDTTGAGDAFVGALAKFLVTDKNQPIHQIIGAACKVATISVTKEGTQSSYPDNIDAFKTVYKYEIL